MADAGGRHGFALQADAKGHIGGNHDLIPGIDAVHIGGGIRFRVAQRLGLLQGFLIGKTQPGHGIQNVIAGAVHDAAHPGNGLGTAGTLQLAEPADAAAHCGSGPEQQALFLCQGDQRIVEAVDQGLIGGNDIFACLHGCANELICRVQATHCLHHGVDGGIVYNIRNIMNGFRIRQLDIFQTQHFFHADTGNCFGQIVQALAHDAKTQQTDIHVSFLLSVVDRKTYVFLWKTLAFYTETVYHIENQIAMMAKTTDIPENRANFCAI